VEIGYHKLVKKVTCHAEVNQSSVIVITHISKPMRAHYFSEVVIINFPIEVSDDDLDVISVSQRLLIVELVLFIIVVGE